MVGNHSTCRTEHATLQLGYRLRTVTASSYSTWATKEGSDYWIVLHVVLPTPPGPTVVASPQGAATSGAMIQLSSCAPTRCSTAEDLHWCKHPYCPRSSAISTAWTTTTCSTRHAELFLCRQPGPSASVEQTQKVGPGGHPAPASAGIARVVALAQVGTCVVCGYWLPSFEHVGIVSNWLMGSRITTVASLRVLLSGAVGRSTSRMLVCALVRTRPSTRKQLYS